MFHYLRKALSALMVLKTEQVTPCVRRLVWSIRRNALVNAVLITPGLYPLLFKGNWEQSIIGERYPEGLKTWDELIHNGPVVDDIKSPYYNTLALAIEMIRLTLHELKVKESTVVIHFTQVGSYDSYFITIPYLSQSYILTLTVVK